MHKTSLVLITMLDSICSISILKLILGNKLDVSELFTDELFKCDVMVPHHIHYLLIELGYVVKDFYCCLGELWYLDEVNDVTSKDKFIELHSLKETQELVLFRVVAAQVDI